MRAKDRELAAKIVQWASMKCGPYADAHKQNMVIMLCKSGANLAKLDKLNPREKMHDINLITQTNTVAGLFCMRKQ